MTNLFAKLPLQRECSGFMKVLLRQQQARIDHLQTERPIQGQRH